MTHDPSSSGTVITFYSYKGGTGRSMAVANAACILARDGVPRSRKVLVVDWDLEAPGLHRFFADKTEKQENHSRPGVINYFTMLQESLGITPGLSEEIANKQGWQVLARVLPIDDYIVSDVEPGVDLMPAGRFDSEYATLTGSFDWVGFYDEFGSAFKAFREMITSRYDYCLIDSRTGLTDTGGICTMLLPEKLVTVFTPNTQSQSGVINIIKDVVRCRRASDDFRPLAVFPLPSRIDLAEIELREAWRQNYQTAFENCFRSAYEIEDCDLTAYFDEVQLPHMSYYAYGESIAVLREGRSEAFSLSRAYQVFMQRLVHLSNSWEDSSVLLAEANQFRAPTWQQLRAPVGDFVGRTKEIDSLINALRSDSRACISGISGMGGIGKTELALLVAERLRDDYPDAQFFINLQGTDAIPRPAQAVLADCIRAFLGPEASLPEDLDQLSQLYRSQLSGKRVLLLLDNAADSAQVRPLIPPTGCALLITSRQAVTLPGMTPLTLSPLNEAEAKELLLEIALRAEPVAEKICALCGYLPLAIRAAGSLLATTADLDPADYAAQLDDEHKRLERIGTEGVELGVEASFNLSYARLASESQRVFRLLSIFPASFDAGAEEVICGDTGHAQLSDLVRRSLVLYDSGTKRYRLHNLTQLFAEQRLGTEERAVGQKRFATHYRDVLAAAHQRYLEGGESLLRSLAIVDLEWDNIQAGHTWVASQTDSPDADFARLGMDYASTAILYLRQRPRERIRWLEIALAAARRLEDRAGEGDTLGKIGVAYINLREIHTAIQFFEHQLAIVREIGDRKGEAHALGNLGLARTNIDETVPAIDLFEQHLTIARELGDRGSEGVALGNLGTAYWKLGENRRAIQLYEQQLIIVREIGDRRGEGNALGGLGVAYDALGETHQAIKFYEQQLAIVREIGDRRGEGDALWNGSLALDRLGDRDQAIQYAEQALAIREQIEDPRAAKVRVQLTEWRETPSRH